MAKARQSKARSCEICILAGGLSQRMGCDKSRLRIGRNTMLGLIRATAKTTGLKVRVIRRDCVPRCGPLGGIYTALRTTHADSVLLLACDMPFIGRDLLDLVLKSSQGLEPTGMLVPAFLYANRRPCFPLVLPRSALDLIARQIQRGHLSLHQLARDLRAKMITVPRLWAAQLRNVNTPADLRLANGRAKPG